MDPLLRMMSSTMLLRPEYIYHDPVFHIRSRRQLFDAWRDFWTRLARSFANFRRKMARLSRMITDMKREPLLML